MKATPLPSLVVLCYGPLSMILAPSFFTFSTEGFSPTTLFSTG